MNINRFLENSVRSDVRGYNIYTRGKRELNRLKAGETTIEQWDEPGLGLPGMISIGHEIDVLDIVVPKFSIFGKDLSFDVMRHHWTPAYSDTMYRCRPHGEYKKSGLITVRERKCFDENDTFISCLTISNDGKDEAYLKIDLSVPYRRVSDGVFSVSSKVMPGSLGKKFELKGFLCAKTKLGDCTRVRVPALSSVEIRYGLAFSPTSANSAIAAVNKALKATDPIKEAEDRFNAWFDKNAPVLKTDNTDLLKIYYYRLFVVKSAIHTPQTVIPSSDFKGECVYESPFGGWFGAPVGLPFPLQVEEMKWLKTKDSLISHIENWCHGYGATQGYIQFTPMAIWDLYLMTGDKEIIEKFYESALKFTLRKTEPGTLELPVTDGSWITGAEYQPAFYQHTDPEWDWRFDSEGQKLGYHRMLLYRLDECVMHLLNTKACRMMAGLLSRSDDEATLSQRESFVLEKIRETFWNEEKEFFFDVDKESGKQCDMAPGYDGFMPMMRELFGDKFHSVFKKLEKGGIFDSGFGMTSIGKNCPMYWFDNCITGPTAASLSEPHPYGCCWNGPIWPFAISLALESLGDASYGDMELKDTFNRLFLEYTELHFNLGDRSAPCIVEHYRPTDGVPFSPQTEYFHSEWVNLLFSYYFGINITERGVTFYPLTDEEFTVEDVVIKGKSYTFSQKLENGKLTKKVTKN